ncbi:MAG: tetratricopeptide repeat protein [Elusimicrobia bacterium]|nr:tetratricopeptide repeat protein [Elusimicrobiota bacterium]
MAPPCDGAVKQDSWWLPALLLAALTITAYAPALRGDFIWDDYQYISENPVLTAPGGLLKIWMVNQTQQYYPATFTAFWLERRLWGLDTFGYHLVNAALHVLNALLAWHLLRRLKVQGAWLAAAVFALHPVQVESVAWITERKNVLSGLFYLLALESYLVFEERRARAWYLGALGLFLLALLSKTTACTLPVVLLLVRWLRGLELGKREFADAAPFFLLGALLALVTVYVEIHHVGAEGPGFALSLLQRLQLAGRAPWFYIMKLVWPADLCFSYAKWSLDARDPLLWLGPSACAAAAACLWRWRERLGRGPLAAVGFFIVTLSPALGLARIYTHRYSYVADHYQYLACLGLIALAAGALARSLSGRPRAWRGAAAVVLALLWLGTWRQARVYRSLEGIWRDTLAKNPESALAHVNLGALVAEQGRLDEAMAHYRAAQRIAPDDMEAYTNLGRAFAKQGRLAEAIAQYEAALQLAPAQPTINNNMGLALFRAGRQEEAVAHFRRALGADPEFVEAYANLAGALIAQGKLDEAIAQCEAALKLSPGDFNARANLGLALAGKGRVDEAIAQFRRALAIRPGNEPAGRYLGALLKGRQPR